MPMDKDPNETQGNPTLAQGRDPKRKIKRGEPGSMGDNAFMDAVIIVIVAWVILVLLAYSLRHHNI
jgi:hypothetical protein